MTSEGSFHVTERAATVKQSKFGAPIDGKTPQRRVRKKYDELKESDKSELSPREVALVERPQSCVGPLVYRVSEAGELGPKGTCVLCSKSSCWYCLGCHAHYCAFKADSEATVRKVVLPTSTGPNKSQVYYIRNTCWLEQHEEALSSLSSESVDILCATPVNI